jgi:hypothetical protein
MPIVQVGHQTRAAFIGRGDRAHAFDPGGTRMLLGGSDRPLQVVGNG